MMNDYEAIIVGAGSIGVPTAMALGEAGVKTLVLDKHASPGQGQNKHAIGGIRATHSDPGKILACLRSLEIFSSWEEKFGDNIEWLKGGYTFPVYRRKEEAALKSILPIQKQFGLNIDFVGPEKIREVIPGINPEELMGGTFSPDDGSASPLLSINAFYRHARAAGVQFRFKEEIKQIIVENEKVIGVATDRDQYTAAVVVDAAGPRSRKLCKTAGIDIPVIPDSHEGAITEPVQPFFTTMVVDLRPGPGSKNYYFYQNKHGQILFCITPDPPIVGTDIRETSVFLPQVCSRMVRLLPRLKNLRVRRVWRGLYPMTPDGSPILGWNRDVRGLLHATGMCGQGYMLGPGAGEVVARMVTGKPTADDQVILEGFSPYRNYGKEEALK
ncbi:MAG: FAD-binding oxidoreductase [Syntrophobacterales bacterium]|nr:MAG: FAD-binding oxidoreductase [Syntrophobacterales bacterium]